MSGPLAPAGRFELVLSAWLDRVDLPPAMLDAIRYSALGGGKRLRPVLAWHAASAVGGKGEHSLPAGLAVELVHCFSLVHDDLPAMDDDDLRRGKPTLHIHSGEAMAVLAGDAMLSLAFHALAEVPDAELSRALTRELTRGTERMIAGQVYDTLGGLPASASALERVLTIHDAKTGALIRAACRMGAMLGLTHADGSDPKLVPITAYAECVGRMFQIVDDLIDEEQESDHAGKRTGKDRAAGKITYPSVVGVDAARREVEALRARAHASLSPLGPPAEGLHELADLLSTRTR